MSRNSTTREQKPKAPDAKWGRKGRTTRKSRDMSTWTRNSWRSAWDWKDQRAVTEGWIADNWADWHGIGDTDNQSIVFTDNRPLDVDQLEAAHSESSGYRVPQLFTGVNENGKRRTVVMDADNSIVIEDGHHAVNGQAYHRGCNKRGAYKAVIH